jgi:hypothetical protein
LIFTEKHGEHSKMSWECSLKFKTTHKRGENEKTNKNIF